MAHIPAISDYNEDHPGNSNESVGHAHTHKTIHNYQDQRESLPLYTDSHKLDSGNGDQDWSREEH